MDLKQEWDRGKYTTIQNQFHNPSSQVPVNIQGLEAILEM
jgi:hypothetical protein